MNQKQAPKHDVVDQLRILVPNYLSEKDKNNNSGSRHEEDIVNLETQHPNQCEQHESIGQ